MASIKEIESVVERLFGAISRPPKKSIQAMNEAEARLGLSLPRMLRDFGTRFGWDGQLATARETLLSPESWRFRGKAFVFCVENQGVVLWGIRRWDLRQNDPPVYVAENREPFHWDRDHDRLSDFFITLAYWQGIVGAKIYGGDIGVDEAVTPEAIAKFERLYSEIPLGRNSWGVRVFEGDGKLFLLQKIGRLTCRVEGRKDSYRTARELQKIEGQTGLEFTYSLPLERGPAGKDGGR